MILRYTTRFVLDSSDLLYDLATFKHILLA